MDFSSGRGLVFRGAGFRKSAVRAGILAVSAAVASLSGVPPVKGDITNGFQGFAAPNVTAGVSSTGIAYNTSAGSFEITNGVASEAASGFDSTPQTITSFDASFTLTCVSGNQSGMAFVIENSSGGTADLGGIGENLGFNGSGASSFAFELDYNATNRSLSTATNKSRAGLAYNGNTGTYTLFSAAQFQQANSPYRNLPVLDSGDPISVNLEYFTNTTTNTPELTANFVDQTTHTGLVQIYSGAKVNIPAIVGANTAFVGFTGATNTTTSTAIPSVQSISKFTFVSNKTYSPIAITPTSYNESGVIAAGTTGAIGGNSTSGPASFAGLTATMDAGTQLSGTTWYEQGYTGGGTYSGGSSSTGLPVGGSTFTSQSDSSHVFTMPYYVGDAGYNTSGGSGLGVTGDVVTLSGASTNQGPSSATITFAKSNQPYNALSFLTASGNGPNVVGLTINYSNGTSSTGLSFLSPDWFSGTPSAYDASGRFGITSAGSGLGFSSVGSTSPNLYEEDVVVPDNVDAVTSVTLNFLGGNATTTGNVFIFAVSGEAGAAGPQVTYTGSSSGSPNYVWNTTNQNFNGVSGAQLVPVAYVAGDQVFFDDTSPAGSHNVTLGAANMNASSWNVNTSTGYTFSGNGMNGSGGLYINGTGGTGVVVLANSNSYTGPTVVSGGLLQMNSGSVIASTVVNIFGGGMNLSSGAQLNATSLAINVGGGAAMNILNGAQLMGSGLTLTVSASGILNVSSGAVLSATSISLSNGGTVNSYTPSLNLTSLTGASTGVLNLNGTALSIPGSTYAGTIGGTAGSVTFTGAGTFAGTITGSISVVKTGAGNQTLTGTNSYSGGTTVSSGTLSVLSAAALGASSSTITMGGGTLLLGGGAPVASQVLTGFSAFAPGNGVEINNGDSPEPATVSGSTLTLTHNTPHSNASIFTNSTIALNLTNGFTVSFLYTPNDPNNASGYPADGAAFVLQNDPNKTLALGDGGGAVGYQGGTDPGFGTGIQNSFAAILGIYEYNNNSDAAFSTNGGAFTYQTTTPQVNAQPDQVTINYNGSNHLVSFTIANASNLTSFTTLTDSVNLATVLGSASAYVGFTGGEGDGSAQQLIQNFTFTNYVNGPVPITQAIVTSPGTTSAIQVSVGSGSNTESIGALNISSGSKLALTTTAGSVGPLVLNPTSLNIATAAGSFTGQLDIGANDLDLPVARTALAAVTAMVKQGYAAGSWTGNGITSSAAANDPTHLTAVGVIVNDNPLQHGTPLYGSGGGISTAFDGDATVSDGDILVKYTYYGDCNLDGAIDGSDYAIVDSTYQSENFSNGAATNPVSGWYYGDFNYDNVVDGSDYTLMDNAFNQQGASLGVNPNALLATATAQIGGTAVPEPATFSLLAVGSLSLLGRRRTRPIATIAEAVSQNFA